MEPMRIDQRTDDYDRKRYFFKVRGMVPCEDYPRPGIRSIFYPRTVQQATLSHPTKDVVGFVCVSSAELPGVVCCFLELPSGRDNVILYSWSNSSSARWRDVRLGDQCCWRDCRKTSNVFAVFSPFYLFPSIVTSF